jgi:Ca-activated chloride channel homolog
MSLLDIVFQERLWIYLCIPAALGLFLIYHFGKRRRFVQLARFVSPQMAASLTATLSTRKRLIKQWLVLIGAALLCLALSRPQLGYYWEERPEQSTDVLIALDTSRSMLAPDVRPNRLFRAQLAIEELASKLKGVRLGLIPFAGEAMLWCPLTYDLDAFVETLRSVDTGIIPVGGTNLLAAVDTAERAFTNDPNASKIMILVTDGEDLTGQLEQRLSRIAKQGWIIHAIGVGSEEGELIPIQNADGSTSYVTDDQGQVIKTRLDAEALRTIATATGGSYHPLGTTGEGLVTLFQDQLQPHLQLREESRLRKIPIERYAWISALVLLILSAELLIPERKKKARTNLANTAVLLFALIVLAATPGQVTASTAREGQRAFDQGEFARSRELFEQALQRSRGAEISKNQFNAGVSALMHGDYDAARQLLDPSAANENLDLQFKAYYNRAIAAYHAGRAVLDSEPQETVKAWEGALEDLKGALALQPDALDAQRNHDEIERLLEKLKELLKDQEQPQDGDGESDNKENSDGESDNKENSDSNEGSEDQENEKQEGAEEQSENPEQQEEGSKEGEQEQEDTQPEEGSEPQKPEQQEGEQEASPKPEPEQQPEPQPQPEQQPASPGPTEQEREALMQLLDSLEHEEGDFREFYFKLQNPDAAKDVGRNW